MNVCDSFLINVNLSDEENKVEVVMYHGYMRETLNLFEGDTAKNIASLLLNRSTIIPEPKVYTDEDLLENLPKVPHLLTKNFIFPEKKEVDND